MNASVYQIDIMLIIQLDSEKRWSFSTGWEIAYGEMIIP
jgi:hypothetical protein